MTRYSYQRLKHLDGSRIEYGKVYHVSDPAHIHYDNIGDFEAGQFDANIERLNVGQRYHVQDGRILVTIQRVR